jgi:mono/diheme cytochrome c family protein
MIRTVCGLIAWALAVAVAFAQQAGPELNDTQRLGRELFNQSCRVCHTPPALNAPLYGPALTQDTQRGKDDILAEVIGVGTPRMPGFKYQYGADQIAAIVAYLRTVPNQQASRSSLQQPTSPPASRSERELQQREAD